MRRWSGFLATEVGPLPPRKTLAFEAALGRRDTVRFCCGRGLVLAAGLRGTPGAAASCLGVVALTLYLRITASPAQPGLLETLYR